MTASYLSFESEITMTDLEGAVEGVVEVASRLIIEVRDDNDNFVGAGRLIIRVGDDNDNPVGTGAGGCRVHSWHCSGKADKSQICILII
jgi:hypothetical protein